MRRVWLIVVGLLIAASLSGVGYLLLHKKTNSNSSPTVNVSPSLKKTETINNPQVSLSANQPTGTVPATLHIPIKDFKQRITKKTFSMYITPATSPVQPERFTGYHTGDDVEYGDVSGEVPVFAVWDGKVIRSGFVSGYGGLIALQHTFNGQSIISLYGHLAPSSLAKIGLEVKAGETIGRLGNAYSSETDGERKHLHFALLKGTVLDVRGYVQNKSELTKWYDPISFY